MKSRWIKIDSPYPNRHYINPYQPLLPVLVKFCSLTRIYTKISNIVFAIEFLIPRNVAISFGHSNRGKRAIFFSEPIFLYVSQFVLLIWCEYPKCAIFCPNSAHLQMFKVGSARLYTFAAWPIFT
jgi:hypothetical protein